MSKKAPSIYWLIFAGVILGITIGLVAVGFGYSNFIKDWISPLGEIFVRILSLIAIPLLFVSLVKGIITIENTTKIMSIGWRTILTYTLTTIVATLFAIALVLILKPGQGISSETSQAFFGEYSSYTSTMIDGINQIEHRSPLDTLVDMIPNNIIAPLSSGSNMLQVLVLAILVGITIVTLKGNKVESVRKLILDVDSLLNHAIDMAMYIAPVGIMALMANVVVDSGGNSQVLRALGFYTLTVLVGLFGFAFIFYPLIIRFLTKLKVRDYLSAVLPAQLMAITTSSSAATLPTTMKVANDDLKIPKTVSSFTLPMGVTINMDGSSIYLSITVIFIAQVMNIDLSMAQIMTVILSSVIASIGTPGIPGGVLVTIVLVLDSIGIPLESIALVVALVRPIDMFVTALNVTGDIAVSAVVANKTTNK